MRSFGWVIVACWVFFATLPLFLSDYFLHLMILVLFYGYLSQAWNIMSGFSGQFSFGHAVFFGTGAYVSSILLTKYGITPWAGMVAGAAIAAGLALFIGFLSFRYRLKGAYFALGTLAFAEILRIVVQNTDYFNKTLGILIPLDPRLSSFQFETRIGYYYTVFIMVTLITFFVHWMSRSRLGFNLIAIRENEDAAQSLGVNAYRNKMIAVAISGAFTAVGGTFYAQYILFIEPPTTFGTDVSITILLPSIIGGAGTVFGPIVGSFIITPLGELTKTLLGDMAGVHLIAYGAILVTVILFMPEGVVGWFQNRRVQSPQKNNEKDQRVSLAAFKQGAE